MGVSDGVTRTRTELFFIALGLLVGYLLTRACAWAYPLGAEVVWWCGGAAMVATVLMGLPPLRRAWRADMAEGQDA